MTSHSQNDAASSGGGPLLYLLMPIPLALALVGAWIGSTLTVFHGGPVWLAIVGSIACFLVIPLLWELLADPDQQGGRLRDAILRSSALSAALIVGLLATHPKSTFEALATRGDWFLGGSRSPGAESVRRGLFKLADGLEWLNGWVRERPWQAIDDGANVDPGRLVRGVRPAVDLPPPEAPAPRPEAPAPTPDAPRPTPPAPSSGPRWAIADSGLVWPLPDTVHPSVTAMPPEARASIKGVGAWLKAQVADPYQRAKALHDFVATHVRYDYQRLRDGTHDHTNQKAEVVFRDGIGVCAGYANLMHALGPHADLEIVRLSGDSRSFDDYRDAEVGETIALTGIGHAWNAVRIHDRWHLLDVTWDAGHISAESGFTAEYKTTYLFIPPEVMTLTHLPDTEKWQLREAPLSRAEWLRQPIMRPWALGIGVVPRDIDSPVIAMRDPLRFTFDNPQGYRLFAQWETVASGRGDFPRCADGEGSPVTTITCPGVDDRARISFFALKPDEDRGPLFGTVIVDD
jgi:hypothetical protein